MYFKRTRHHATPDLRCLAILTTMNCGHHVATPAMPATLVSSQASLPRNPVTTAPVQPAVVNAEAPRAIPLNVMAGAIEPLRADDPTLPDAVLVSAHGRTLDGAYKICISTAGSVKTVTPVVSIAGADAFVMSTLRTWKFPELPTEMCKIQTFSFEVP